MTEPGLNSGDKQRIIERYDARFAEFGYDIRTLASGTHERHRLRHQVITQVGIEPGSSVLDLGCGFGDYFGYLRSVGLEVRYTGYDINPTLVRVARERYPDAEFEVRDVLAEEFPEFDYIVSSNAFNLRLDGEDNYRFAEEVLRVCHAHSRRGTAIDFLTSYVDFESPDVFHYEPERLFAAAKRLTKRVCLRHDYPLFEFCLYLYPDFGGWRHGE